MAKRKLAYFDQALAAYRRGDYPAAYEGFAAIAEEGDAAAQCNLAGMYESGLGVQQSDRRALYWYLRAAEQGMTTAQFALGIKLRHGFGTERDDIAALMWFRIAAETMEPGEERAELIRNLDFTKSGLTTHEVAEAERAAQEWWEERGGVPEASDQREDD